jgi:hypothetical protein
MLLVGFVVVLVVGVVGHAQNLGSPQKGPARIRNFAQPGKIVLFLCKGEDLSESDARILWAHKPQLEAEVQQEFAPLPISIVFMPCEILTTDERQAILEAGMDCPRPTVILVFLTGESTPKEKYRDKGLLGLTVRNGAVFVFTDHLKRDVRSIDELVLRIGAVTAHEVGHNLRFEFYNFFYGTVKSFFSNKILGMEGRGIPRNRTYFDSSDAATAKAIYLVNNSNHDGCAHFGN